MGVTTRYHDTHRGGETTRTQRNDLLGGKGGPTWESLRVMARKAQVVRREKTTKNP